MWIECLVRLQRHTRKGKRHTPLRSHVTFRPQIQWDGLGVYFLPPPRTPATCVTMLASDPPLNTMTPPHQWTILKEHIRKSCCQLDTLIVDSLFVIIFFPPLPKPHPFLCRQMMTYFACKSLFLRLSSDRMRFWNVSNYDAFSVHHCSYAYIPNIESS